MRTNEKIPDLEGLALFDSCVTLGRIVHSAYQESLTVDKLLTLMDKYEIREALVHDHHARLTYPREHGNQRLLKNIKGQSRLHPVWVLEPPRQIGKEAAAEVVKEMLDSGVKAARLPLKVAPPLLWLWADLLDELDRHSVPCFMDLGGVSTSGDATTEELNGIREIALAHPDLPLIFSNTVGGLGIHTGIVPLIKRLPNLYIDITGVLNYWREAAYDAGPRRVLFASGMPFTDPGIYISNVQYERHLDEKAKKSICGDTLRSLLGAMQ